MRHNRLSTLVLSVLIFVSSIMTISISARAEEKPISSVKAVEKPPHLIQTVTHQDIYEGLLTLDLLECPILDEENSEAAYENVKDCVVRLDMGNAYGSGMIWEMTPERIVIVTNKHVLEYWDADTSNVCFSQGFDAEAEILGISEKYDIGFLGIDNQKLGYGKLEQLQYVHWDMAVYQELEAGDDVFYVGMASETAEDTMEYFEGSIGNMWRYIEEFSEYMIYGYGNAVPGMSGGGTFDAKGNFIGMISGGTLNSETASVPLPVIIEAFEELH